MESLGQTPTQGSHWGVWKGLCSALTATAPVGIHPKPMGAAAAETLACTNCLPSPPQCNPNTALGPHQGGQVGVHHHDCSSAHQLGALWNDMGEDGRKSVCCVFGVAVLFVARCAHHLSE